MAPGHRSLVRFCSLAHVALAALPAIAAAQQPAPRPNRTIPTAPRAQTPAPAALVAPEVRLLSEPPWLTDLLSEVPFEADLPALLDLPLPADHLLFTHPEVPLAAAADLALDHPAVAPLSWPQSIASRQEPQDSVYRQARVLLNRGEYRRAAELFHDFERRNASSRYVASAMYYRAFALYRAGTEADLRSALQVLDQQRARFAAAATDKDVAALVTRVTGALASRGDREAAHRLREGASDGVAACDREDMEVRAEALSALVQNDPAGSADVLRRILSRRDECTAPLRRRAVYLLGRDGAATHSAILLDVARHDPSSSVKSDAIGLLAQLPGPSALPALQQLLDQSDDESTQRAVLQALRRVDDPGATGLLRRLIEREDASETLRMEAVRSLGRASSAVTVVAPRTAGDVVAVRSRSDGGLSESDAAFLRTVYGRTSSRNLKRTIIETMARSGSAANDQWLMGIVRDGTEELRYRSAALGRLQRADVPLDELIRLYDDLTERDLRSTMVSILGSREEPAATDKLLEIARSGTDPSIRRMAITALSRKNDPRTTRLLLELVEK